MEFQLGAGGFQRFVEFIDALEHRDFNRAADELIIRFGTLKRRQDEANIMLILYADWPIQIRKPDLTCASSRRRTRAPSADDEVRCGDR